VKGRGRIKSQIIDAWTSCVQTDYVNQRINSERSLQAAFWAQLNERLPANRRLFIEPGISIRTSDGIKKVIPDIVVCNSLEVIAVIELKYRPKGPPSYQKDIQTLDLIARNRGGIAIANERFRGAEKDARRYTASKKILFVWAGVHSAPAPSEEKLFEEGTNNLSGSYLQLHAATRSDRAPDVYYYSL